MAVGVINLYLLDVDGSARGFGTCRELDAFMPESHERDCRLYGFLPLNPNAYTRVELAPALYDSRAMMRHGEWIEVQPAHFVVLRADREVTA